MGVELQGLDQLLAGIDQKIRWLDGVVPIIQGECENGRMDMQAIVQIRSGYARDHLINEDLDNGGSIWSQAGYSQALEFGRGEVRPVYAKALHWVDANGKDVFTMRSGPARPYPFFVPVKEVLLGRIADGIRETW